MIKTTYIYTSHACLWIGKLWGIKFSDNTMYYHIPSSSIIVAGARNEKIVEGR